LTLGFETQHAYASAARIELCDIQRTTDADAIARTGVAPNHIKIVVPRELLPLRWRVVAHKQP
jgi:hypothetical protein